METSAPPFQEPSRSSTAAAPPGVIQLDTVALGSRLFQSERTFRSWINSSIYRLFRLSRIDSADLLEYVNVCVWLPIQLTYRMIFGEICSSQREDRKILEDAQVQREALHQEDHCDNDRQIEHTIALRISEAVAPGENYNEALAEIMSEDKTKTGWLESC